MTETTFTLTLNPDTSQQLGPIRDDFLVETHHIGDCRISTTITDVHFGRWHASNDDKTGTEACVIYARFEFGQLRNERIKRVQIRLSFFEKGTSTSSAGSAMGEHGGLLGWWSKRGARNQQKKQPARTTLKIMHREPENWIGQRFTKEVGDVAAAGVSIGVAGPHSLKANISRSENFTQMETASLTSIRDSPAVLIWTLQENPINRTGIPHDFRCAVVLKTAGVDFSGRVEFKAWVGRGLQLAAKKDSFMSSEVFRRRNVVDEKDGRLLERMETREFSEELERRVENRWDQY